MHKKIEKDKIFQNKPFPNTWPQIQNNDLQTAQGDLVSFQHIKKPYRQQSAQKAETIG